MVTTVITGGSSGIGLGVANALHSDGHRVIIASMSPLDESYHSIFEYHRLDVRDDKAVTDFYLSLGEKLDNVVHCAGLFHHQPIESESLENWQALLDVNLTGAFLSTKAALTGFLKRGGGRIINIGSIADRLAIENNAAYCASKYGLRGLTEVTNCEYRHKNIFATLLSLGATKTPLWQDCEDVDKEAMMSVETVASAVRFVLSLPKGACCPELQLEPMRGLV